MSPSTQQALESAVGQFQSGNLDAAGLICASILEETPKNGDALHLMGAVRLRQNDPASAVDLLNRALRAVPRNVEILANLGAALRATGDTDKAASILKKAVKSAPKNAGAHLNYANLLAETGDNIAAERHYRRALQIRPNHPGTLHGLGALYIDLDRTEDALKVLETLAPLVPQDAPLLATIGALRAECGDDEGAETALRASLSLNPDNLDATSNLANVLACRWAYDEALALYERVIAANPNDPDTLSNMANTCRRSGDMAQAVDLYARALQNDPDHLEANAGLANCELANGHFKSGWRLYLRRESVRAAETNLARTPLAQDLRTRRVTVIADQGLGDEIFFLRFAATLRARGALVSYRPEPRLGAMLERADIVDTVLPADAAPDNEQVIAVGDLPALLEMADDDTPPASIALPPIPAVEDDLRKLLHAFGPPPWIGVTWRAGTANKRRLLFKEVPAALIAGILPPDATVVAIQRGARDGEIDAFAQELGRPVLDLSDANDDLERLLALSGLLDDYVTVSNTMVHMRAARGRTSHLVVPAPAEFRWMASGSQSPWFPGSPVYRQSSDGSWTEAFDTLEDALERHLVTYPR